MGPPNTTWAQILAQARQNSEVLKQQEVVRSIQNVLQTNVSVCTSLGQPFVVQFNVIFTDMLQVRMSWVWGSGEGCVYGGGAVGQLFVVQSSSPTCCRCGGVG